MSDRRFKTMKALGIATACCGPPKTTGDQLATTEALVMVLAATLAAGSGLGQDGIQPLGTLILGALPELIAQVRTESN